MCGILGFINVDKIVQKARKDWFRDALFVDQIRGPHATGVYVQGKPTFQTPTVLPQGILYKRALEASDFLRLSNVQSILRDTDDCRVAIGHNRYATQGATGLDSNAHPFKSGHIVLVHNGTLTSRRGLDHYDIVDSFSIAKQLEATEPDQYTSVLKQLDGAFTLIWVNTLNNKVYFARNTDRPLYMAYGNDKQTLFFASEAWMISGVLDHNRDLDILDRDAKRNLQMREVPVNKLFSVDYTEPEIILKEKEYTPDPKPTWAPTGGTQRSPITHPTTTHITNLTAVNTQCPFALGSFIYADRWEFTPHKKRNIGSLAGVVKGFPNVNFVCANFKQAKEIKLRKDWDEWVDTILDGKKGDMNTDILLEGVVCAISKIKGKNKWIVNLRPSTIKVEAFDADEEEAHDDPSIHPLVPVLSGEIYKVGDRHVSAGEWCFATADGCSLCGNKIFLKDALDIAWMCPDSDPTSNDLEPVCKGCLKDAVNI